MGRVTTSVLGALFRAPPAPVVATGVVVKPDNASLMQRRGWRDHGRKRFTGHYATRFGSFAGEIKHSAGEWQVYVRNPPESFLRSHPKRSCFHKYSNGWWNIHLHTQPCNQDENAIVAYVELLLSESKG